MSEAASPIPAVELAGASPAAICHHYDVNTEFFRLWLDDSLTYSCPLWQEGDTLAQAQMRKLDDLATRAGAVGAARVIDIGCGWGSMLERLTTTHQVGHATGLTLSNEHAAYINHRIAMQRAAGQTPRIAVCLESWQQHQAQQQYDAAISIGAFEHFARFGQRSSEKVASYRLFFQRCHEWLRPASKLTLQTVAKGNTALDRQGMEDAIWMYTEIFPESDLPRLCEIMQACERLFEVVTVRNHREQYAYTCNLWNQRLQAKRSEAVALVGEEVVARYERYLQTCVRFFDSGVSTLLRLEFLRVN